MKVLRVASRDSQLGVAWAHDLMQAIRSYDPLIVPELISIPPEQNAEAGCPYFAPMQRALENGEVDLCVSGLEYLPIRLNPKLPIVAVSRRREVRDVLLRGVKLKEPNLTRPIAAQNSRRWVQLARLYPGWRVERVAQSVSAYSLLERLDDGEFGALVLSELDANLMGQQHRIHLALSEHQVITSPGQGMVSVQARLGEQVGFLAKYHNVDSWDMATAERSFADVFFDSPETPFAVRASMREGKLNVRGMIADQKEKQYENAVAGDRNDAVHLGTALAVRLQMDTMNPEQRKAARLGLK